MTEQTFRDLVDLASERLGGSVLYATDDYFAEKENLLRQSRAVWKEHEYTDRGKWMDGWESRRKRVPGHDYAIIRLGLPGIIRGVVVDTAFFRGNYPSHCSIETLYAPVETQLDALLSETAEWTEILPQSELRGDSENLFEIDGKSVATHVRLRIYPDGGVARFRVHGDVVPDWHRHGGLQGETDLAAIEHGGEVLTCSDMFFGPKHNLIMPGRSHNMSDGWETKRRRGPGHDWVIVRLGAEGVIRRIELDTNHFKGNFPDTCSIDASIDGREWREILLRTKMQAHTRHMFIDELDASGPASYVRLNVYPDGGVARMRVYGTATEAARGAAVTQRIDALPKSRAAAELRRCCAAEAWVEGMIAARPFNNWDSLAAAAGNIWMSLSPNDWKQAFAAHPRIGEKRGTKWSAQEQAGTARATDDTLSALHAVNEAYEKKFGHVFLICATGRSAEEMLASLRERIDRSADEELRIAAEEQRKITLLRLMKLVE